NLDYLFVKRIECARATLTANLPYGMFLTRLYRHVMEHYPPLDNGIYNVVDRAFRLLTYQRTDIPTFSQQDDDLLFERQTVLLNQSQQIHEEVRGGFKSFEKALRGVFGKKKK
ncbi:hypothetical protein Tco_1277638, partial [Tanacetum coccineum]